MNNFYWENYIHMYPELKIKKINTKNKAWNHYINFGSKEKKIICKYLNENNFDWEHYINLYEDLRINGYNTKDKAWNHWIYTGKNEGRIIADLNDKKIFDWQKYINYYTDLKLANIDTYDKAWYHWINQGRFENRFFFNIKDQENEKQETGKIVNEKPETGKIVNEKPETGKIVNEKPETGKILNEKPETGKIVNEKPETGKIVNEKPETGKIVNEKPETEKIVNEKPETGKIVNEKPETEKIVNEKPETEKIVNEKPETEKIVNEKPETGKIVNEKPETGKIVNKNLTNNYYFDKNDYLIQLDIFSNIYKKNTDDIFSDPKNEFRYFCFRYLNYIRLYELPEIPKESKMEAVLIEYRCFPHIEFILRNTINKLGENWAHTIICGNNNYNFVKNIINNISSHIKIINSGHENLTQNDYSNFLTTKKFWDLLVGEKILIYQEDTCIFKKNIYDFINFDYIGAPWNKNQNDTPNNVGNGGLSLRTKKCMIDVINTITLENTVFNSSTIKYCKSVNLSIGPEDVYFSLNMQKYNIGIVADWDSAYCFSSESINNKNSFGGHNFWLSDPNWKERLYKDIIIQFKPMYSIENLEHRGGWKYVLNNLNNIDFYNNNSDIYFYDIIERYFIFDDIHIIGNKWAGILHCTPKAPPYLDIINIKKLFLKKKFIDSLKDCIFILTLSTYVLNFLKKEFIKNNLDIEVYMIKHPVIDQEVIYFSIEKYIKNENKYLIQIGQQLRKMTSIFKVNINEKYKKLWLLGTKNYRKCKYLLNEEIKYLKIDKINMNDIFLYYTEIFSEYDELLSKNIVFVDLFDAAANNTVIECIIRNTPIIINKIEGVIEYLGENYPLYFKNLSEVNDLLSTHKLINAYNYLKNMNKQDLTIKYFTSKLINYIINSKRIKCFDLSYKENILCIYTTLIIDDCDKLIFDILKYFIFFKNSKVIIFISDNEKIVERKLTKLLGISVRSLIKIYNILLINEFIDKIDFFINIGNYKLPQINGLANKYENNIFYYQFQYDLNEINEINEYNTLSKYKYIVLNSDFTKDIYIKFTNNYITNQIIKIIYPCCFEKNNSYDNIKKDKSFVIIGNDRTFDIAIKYFKQIEEKGEYILHIIFEKHCNNSFLNYIKTFNCKNVYFHINILEEEQNIILHDSKYIINFDDDNFSILKGINYGCIPISINKGYPSYYINKENGIIFKNEIIFYDIIYDIIINNKQYHYNYDFYDKFLYNFTSENYNNSIDTFFKVI